MKTVVLALGLALVVSDASALRAVGACDPTWQQAIERIAIEGMKRDIGRGWSTGLRNSESIQTLSCYGGYMDMLRQVNVVWDPARALAWLINKACQYMQAKVSEVTNFDAGNFLGQLPSVPGLVVDTDTTSVGGNVGVTLPNLPTVGGSVTLPTEGLSQQRQAVPSGSSGGWLQ